MDLIPGTARPVLVPKNGWPGLNMRAPTLSRLHLIRGGVAVGLAVEVCDSHIQDLPRVDRLLA